MNIFKLNLFFFALIFLSGCIGSMNPAGGNSSPNYPYFVTTQPMVVKRISIPAGTTLTYEEQFLKEGAQTKALSEKNLITITFAPSKRLMWGGVPVISISKFFNSEMRGYSVEADFEKLPADKKTKFSKLWESCSDVLGITIKNSDDWSFNKKNIADVESCSVNNQRYFKEDAEQQNFLNETYQELLKVESK